METIITPRHHEIMRHALGLSQYGREYRNRYVPGGKDVEDCEQLVKLGLMERHEVEWILDPLFTVTETGKEIARAGQKVQKQDTKAELLDEAVEVLRIEVGGA